MATMTIYGDVNTSLSAANTTGAGTAFQVPARDGIFPNMLTWTTSFTGTPTAITVNLEGSLDGTNWFTLDSSTSTTAEMRHVVNKPCLQYRANISAYTVNSSTATVKFMLQRYS